MSTLAQRLVIHVSKYRHGTLKGLCMLTKPKVAKQLLQLYFPILQFSSLPSISNTPKLSRIVYGTSWFDSIHTESICTTRSQERRNNDTCTWAFLVLNMWQQTSVDSSEALYDSTRCTCSRSTLLEVKIHANRLPAWWIDSRGNNLCWFDRIKSNRQHFQLTLHSPGALDFLSLAQINFRHNKSTAGDTILSI